MAFDFTDTEYTPLATLPIESIVDLAAELNLLAPESIDRRQLLAECVEALVKHASSHGLPFSKYDAEDLEALSAEDLAAIGRLMGIKGVVKVRAVVKRGLAVYKQFNNRRVDHPIPLMLPMLLTAVARAARMG